MRYLIFSCVFLICLIIYTGYCQLEEDEEKNDQILSERIVEHRYLYQNGKVIEMTKKIVTMKRNEK